MAAVRALTERDPGWVAALGDDARAALARAAHHGRIEALRLMLEAGFPVTSNEGMDATALHWAAWTGQAEAVRLLLAAGAPVDVRDRTYGSSPLAWACHGARFTRQAQSPYLQIVDALIAAGSTREPAINRWGEGPEVFASAELAANLVAAGLVSAELWAAVELDREPEAG